MKHAIRTLFLFFSLFAVTISASATMNIHTIDGQIIQVPVKKSDVTIITYNDSAKPPQVTGDIPWVVNDAGNIYSRTGNSWRRLPGLAKDIGVGAGGTVWVIGHDRVPGGFGIHRWNGSNWNKIDGGAVRIAVAPDGSPWVVNDAGNIYSRTGNSCQGWPKISASVQTVLSGSSATTECQAASAFTAGTAATGTRSTAERWKYQFCRHNGCQLPSRALKAKRPAILANVGYAVEKQLTTAQSHNQGGRS